METLITGGTGLVGRHLVPELQARGDRVRVLALPGEDTAWLERRGVAVHRGDVRQPATLAAATDGVDRVFHLAALQGVWLPFREYYAVNVAGTEHVCRAALAAGVRRVVHVSSWTIYGMGRGGPVSEDMPPAPWHDPYWITKAQGDLLVRRLAAAAGLPAVVVRPGTLFGPGDRLNFGRIADRLRAGRGLIIGSGRNHVPFIYVTDLVRGLLLALDHEPAVGQAYNIGNDLALTQKQLLDAIAEEIGAAAPRVHVPYHPLYAAAYTAERLAALSGGRLSPILTRHGVKLYGADNLLSIDKARRELGFSPQVPVREGVRLAAAWYRTQDAEEREMALASTSHGTPDD